MCVHVCKCRSIKFPRCSDTTPISLTVYTLRRTLHLCVLSWRWRLGYTQRGFWSDKLFTVFPLIATLMWSLEWKASIGHMLHIFSTSIVSKVISKQSFLGGGKWKFKRSCSRLFCWCSRAYTGQISVSLPEKMAWIMFVTFIMFVYRSFLFVGALRASFYSPLLKDFAFQLKWLKYFCTTKTLLHFFKTAFVWWHRWNNSPAERNRLDNSHNKLFRN